MMPRFAIYFVTICAYFVRTQAVFYLNFGAAPLSLYGVRRKALQTQTTT